jgi:hypothetical protein
MHRVTLAHATETELVTLELVGSESSVGAVQVPALMVAVNKYALSAP